MCDEGVQRLPRNSLYNLAGLGIPLLVAFATTPFVIARLGEETFGLYMLALSVVGVGGLLDFGLSTASVKFVAEYRAKGDAKELSNIINSLLLSRVPLAAAVALVGVALAPNICDLVLVGSTRMRPDAVFVVRVLLVTLGIGMLSGSLAALPRAAHRFDITSSTALMFSLSLTAATVGLLLLGHGLRAIVVAELFLAVIQLAVYWEIARRVLPNWRFELRISARRISMLLSFGGWVTLSTIAGVAFIHGNRILVGRLLGIAAVTYLAVPWNLSARITQLVYGLTEAVTPVASGLTAAGGTETLRVLHRRATRLVALIVGTVAVPLVLVSYDLLTLWLGQAFADRSAQVLVILVFSTSIHSLAMTPYFILNGMGRPAAANVPGLMGAILNLTLALWLAPRFGLPGVAVAFLVGVGLQMILVVLAVQWAVGLSWGFTIRELWRPILAAIGALSLGTVLTPYLGAGWQRLFALGIEGILCFHALLWVFGFYERAEVDFLVRVLRKLSGRADTSLESAAPSGEQFG